MINTIPLGSDSCRRNLGFNYIIGGYFYKISPLFLASEVGLTDRAILYSVPGPRGIYTKGELQ